MRTIQEALLMLVLASNLKIGASVCRYGLGKFGPAGGDLNQYAELARTNHQSAALLAIVAIFVVVWLACRLHRKGPWVTLQVARVILALACVALSVVAVRTASMPVAQHYLDE